jgi:hypothetical protein
MPGRSFSPHVKAAARWELPAVSQSTSHPSAVPRPSRRAPRPVRALPPHHPASAHTHGPGSPWTLPITPRHERRPPRGCEGASAPACRPSYHRLSPLKRTSDSPDATDLTRAPQKVAPQAGSITLALRATSAWKPVSGDHTGRDVLDPTPPPIPAAQQQTGWPYRVYKNIKVLLNRCRNI